MQFFVGIACSQYKTPGTFKGGTIQAVGVTVEKSNMLIWKVKHAGPYRQNRNKSKI